MASATSSPEVTASSLFFTEQQRQCGDVVLLQGRDRGLHRLIRGREGALRHGARIAGADQASRAKPHEGAQLHFNKRFIIAYSVWVEWCALYALTGHAFAATLAGGAFGSAELCTWKALLAVEAEATGALRVAVCVALLV